MPFHVNDSFGVVNSKCENMRFVLFLRARDIDFFNCEVKAVCKVFTRQLKEKRKRKILRGPHFLKGPFANLYLCRRCCLQQLILAIAFEDSRRQVVSIFIFQLHFFFETQTHNIKLTLKDL